MRINMEINGLSKIFHIEPDEHLLDVLRGGGFKSVKRGCDTSSCGVCTVLMDGNPVLSCSVLAAKADGHKITTVEGIREEATKLAEFLVAEGTDQCGYCSPGLVLCIHAMKRDLVNPTEEDVKDYLAGNLCRCSGYVAQHRAIMKYLEAVK